MLPDHIKQILQNAFDAKFVEVIDESRSHAGHAQAQKSGGGHYEAVIVSERFTGKTLLERHRMVYEALGKEMKSTIHALKIRAFTEKEWKGIRN